jgi:Leucine-rich repeat (LRR) protein
MGQRFFSSTQQTSKQSLEDHKVHVIAKDLLTLRRFLEDNREYIPTQSYPAQESLLTSYARIDQSTHCVSDFDMSLGDWYPNITALGRLSGLRNLSLNSGVFQDIPDLRECSRLKHVSMRSCKNMRSCAELSNVLSLESVNLEGSPIRDISPLSSLSLLQEVRLSYCNISSIQPLEQCQALRVVQVWQGHYGCESELDLSPLLSLPNLTHVWVTPTEKNKKIRIALMERDVQVIDWDALRGARSGSIF